MPSVSDSWAHALLFNNTKIRTFLAVQRLRLCASNLGGTGLISGCRTKIPHAAWPQKKKKNIHKHFLKKLPELPGKSKSKFEMKTIGGVVLGWQRNRMGRPLSAPQIHQKNISTLSKCHKTTSECCQRTSGIQKSRSLSSKTDF